VLCTVGESGAGKSVALHAVMRLLPARIRDISGTITIAGKDVTQLDRRALGDLRGAEVHRLQRELQMAVLFVTHDVGVAVEMSDRIAVMYAAASSRRDRCTRSFAIRND
jgi:ABC-type dipeptide/oligopeptide/nickel transport system ATPase component